MHEETNTQLDERTLETALAELLGEILVLDPDYDAEIEPPEVFQQLRHLRTFQEAMLLTHNRGLVLKFSDGSEFQIQILQSK